MPPVSARNVPALEVSRPGDSTGDRPGSIGCREQWRCLFGCGPADWRPVTVEGWWLDDSGRQVVALRWTAEASSWSGTFLDDEARLVDPDPGEPTVSPRRG